MVKNHEKILIIGSESGSSPKSNQFVLVTHPTCSPNFNGSPGDGKGKDGVQKAN